MSPNSTDSSNIRFPIRINVRITHEQEQRLKYSASLNKRTTAQFLRDLIHNLPPPPIDPIEQAPEEQLGSET